MRSLLTSGIVAGGLAVIENLGVVPRAVALQGVEVTATIPAHGSVTFEFEAEAAGDYLLEVRHIGEGLTIEAKGPSGSASIDPGPAGPFKTIPLSLKAAQYDIKASAVGDRPVFVDWELLLESGVGQSAARGATLSAPSVGLPPASTASTTAAPSASASASGVSANPAENWGGAVTPSMVATAGPIGRLEADRAIAPVGPTSPEGKLAMASAGDGLPAGALAALGSGARGVEESTSIDPTLPATPLLTLELLGDAGQDRKALAASSWLERLAVARDEAMAGPAALPTGPGSVRPKAYPDEVGLALASTEEVPTGPTMSAASPGLITGGLILALAFRKRPNFLPRPKHRNVGPWSEARRNSMG